MNQKEAIYTRPKTVRFDDETWAKIKIAARKRGITTSECLRDWIECAVAAIDLGREVS